MDVKRLVNTEGVTNHTALLPTKNKSRIEFENLTENQRKVLELVYQNLEEATSKPFKYKKMKVTISYAGEKLYEAARCRQLADWIVGMNATRFYTCRYKNKVKKLGKNTLSVGRVVSPTLAMVIERENEIKEFSPETYYTVNLNVGGIIFKSRRVETKEEANSVEQKCRKTYLQVCKSKKADL